MASHAIRVVDSAQRVQDVLALGKDELERTLSDMVDSGAVVVRDPDDPERAAAGNAAAIRAFAGLAAEVQERVAEQALPDSVPLLASRQLLLDRGVLPVGLLAAAAAARPRNGVTAARTAAAQARPDFVARPPVAKELWADTPPAGAAGHSYSSWATAAEPESKVDLEDFVVAADMLGRKSSSRGDGPLQRRDWSEDLASTGGVPLGVVQGAGALLNVRPVPAALAAARDLRAGFFDLPPLLAERPRMRETRLAAGSFSGPRACGEKECPRVMLAGTDDAAMAKLGASLNHFYKFAASSAALVAEMAFPGQPGRPGRPGRPGGETGDTGPRAKAAETDPAAPIGAVLVPLGLESPQARAAEAKYKAELEYVDAQLREIQGLVVAADPRVPLNVASRVLRDGGAAPLRDLLRGRPGADEFFAQMRSEKLAREVEAAAARAVGERTVTSRQYLVIVSEKLGSGRYEKVLRFLLADLLKYDIDNPADVLAAVRGTSGKGASANGAAEARLVKNEFDTRAKAWKLEMENNCPHVKIAQDLRAAVTHSAKRGILKKLEPFFQRDAAGAGGPKPARAGGPKAAARKEWIACRQCSFRVVCPHVLRRLELEFRQASYAEIRRGLEPFASRVRYDAPGGALDYAFYCETCGEELFSGVEEPDQSAERLGAVGTFDDELRKFIWVSAMKVLDPRDSRAAAGRDGALLGFDRPVNPAKLAEEAALVCHPLVAVGASRGVSRRLAAAQGGETARNQQLLLALTYLYAYFFGLALGAGVAPAGGKSSLGDGVQVTVAEAGKGGKGGGPAGRPGQKRKPAADDVARILLSHLVRTHSYLISQLPGVTNEQIGNQFREAYRRIQDTHGRLIYQSRDSLRIFVTSLTVLNPYFQALRDAQRVTAVNGGRGVKSDWAVESPAEAARLFERIMGGPAKDFLTEKFPERYALFVRQYLTRRGGIEYPTEVGPDWVYLLRPLQLFRRAWGTRDGRAEKYWAKRLAGAGAAKSVSRLVQGGKGKPRRPARKFKLRAVGAIEAAYEFPYEDALYLCVLYEGVHDEESLERYSRALAVARERSDDRRYVQKIHASPPKNNWLAETGAGTTRAVVPRGLPLSRLYDEEGVQHRWDTFLWAPPGKAGKAKGAGKQLTRKEIGALIAAGEEPFPGMVFRDWVCSGCGVRRSETSTLDEAKVVKQVRAQSRLAAFFIFFESRCPEGGVHAFAESGGAAACEKCKVDSALLTPAGRALQRPAAIKFFGKYEELFEERVALNTAPAGGAGRKGAPVAALVKGRRGAAPPAGRAAGRAARPSRNYDAVLELNKIMEGGGRPGGAGRKKDGIVTVSAIEALGANEGRTIAEVRAGKNVPDGPATLGDARLLAVDGNVRALLSAYCRLYYGVPPPGAPKGAGRDGPGAGKDGGLPAPATFDVKGKYFEPYAAAAAAAREAIGQRDEAGEEEWATGLLNMSIDFFSSLAVAMVKGAPEPFRELVVSEVRDIVFNEGLFSIAGEFQWSVFGEAGDGSRSASAGDSSNDDVRRYGGPGVETEDVHARQARANAEGGAGNENRFSLDAVDISNRTAEANLEG